MSNNNFFAVQTEQSKIKAEIVFKYFRSWASIMAEHVQKHERAEKKIAYLDLFSGPGRYTKNASASTPILILEYAISNEKIRNKLVTTFNDADLSNPVKLRGEIDTLPGIDKLRYQPEIYNTEVDEEITKMFEGAKRVPSLIFADPWGYKGLSLNLIGSTIQSWGCDCIFFFNYNRINMGLSNPLVTPHMNALFGEARANELGRHLRSLHPHTRETIIIEKFVEALEEVGGKYVLPYSFKDDHGTRTTHHIVFVSKHTRGYTIIKRLWLR